MDRCVKLFFYFRCCCGSALFQKQPVDFAEPPVLMQEIVVRCYLLHNVSTSSSVLDGFGVCCFAKNPLPSIKAAFNAPVSWL
jgi:hypothetical protein